MSNLFELTERRRQGANVGKANPLDAIETLLRSKWPELYTMKNVWVTGGTIWRPVYGLPISTAKDIDIVATSWWSFRKLRKFMESTAVAPVMSNYLGGHKYLTPRGDADIWRGGSIKQLLEKFTGDKANVRMAFSPTEQRLIVLPTGR